MATFSVCTIHLLRWAVLKHTTSEGVHWDLFLEPAKDQKLLTWRINSSPTQWLCGAQELGAQLIGDHRSIYLTYEGEISGNRGQVSREASGTWKPVEISSNQVIGLLTGGMSITLKQQQDDRWVLSIQRI